MSPSAEQSFKLVAGRSFIVVNNDQCVYSLRHDYT